ncbi:hypothetical protein AXX17_AT4G08830 [Arabidopsis thaliana]|uniref:Uncharacterized protein n=1 Tax=Arabidopsis thaliana TaxID=3702 RepID=A0A178V2A3_ARATH|nr:hypothetical protein AXX17_AT4G08830 [Arabidopsis thaliana]
MHRNVYKLVWLEPLFKNARGRMITRQYSSDAISLKSEKLIGNWPINDKIGLITDKILKV